MASELVSILSVLDRMKKMYDEIEEKKIACRAVLQKCIRLRDPLRLLGNHKDRLEASSHLLSSLLKLIDDCEILCRKFLGKRWVTKVWNHITSSSKTKFAEMDAQLCSIISELNLGISADSAINWNKSFEEMQILLRNDLKEELRKVVEITGRQEEIILSSDKVKAAASLMANSEELISIAEDSSDATSDKVHMHRLSKLLVIDHSQLNRENETLLGIGAFGKVFKCQYKGVNVALKVFDGLKDCGSQVLSFKEKRAIEKEALIMQLASFSPNIIGFRGVNIDMGLLIMDLAICSLFDLYHRPHSIGQLNEKQKVELFRFPSKLKFLSEIASAIRFIHFHGVLHRDIKASNIVISHDLTYNNDGVALKAVLTDFGLATAVGLTTVASSTGILSRYVKYSGNFEW